MVDCTMNNGYLLKDRYWIYNFSTRKVIKIAKSSLTNWNFRLLILKQIFKLQIDLGVEILKFQKVSKLSIYNVPFWHVDRTSGTQLDDINYVRIFFDALSFYEITRLNCIMNLENAIKLMTAFLCAHTSWFNRLIHRYQTEYFIILCT